MDKFSFTFLLAGLLAGCPVGAAPPAMGERTAACVACHGAQGRATSQGYFPRIAGKPQAYLYQQLLNFRDGRRINPQMAYMLAHLSDDYLYQMAGHFARQNPPYPAPRVSDASAATLARGRQLVLQGDPAGKVPACVACHGQQLGGMLPGIPGLLGLPRDYLNLQFGAWRNGVRRAAAPDCMAQIAKRLAPADVVALAAWLAAQPVPPGYAQAPAAPLPITCSGAAGAP